MASYRIKTQAPPMILKRLHEERNKAFEEDETLLNGKWMYDPDNYNDGSTGELSFKKHRAWCHAEWFGLQKSKPGARYECKQRNIVSLILIEQDGMCAGLASKDTMGEIEACDCNLMNTGDIKIDHIIELRYGGKDEFNNLQALCSRHHDIKTRENTPAKMGLPGSSHQNYY